MIIHDTYILRYRQTTDGYSTVALERPLVESVESGIKTAVFASERYREAKRETAASAAWHQTRRAIFGINRSARELAA